MRERARRPEAEPGIELPMLSRGLGDLGEQEATEGLIEEQSSLCFC